MMMKLQRTMKNPSLNLLLKKRKKMRHKMLKIRSKKKKRKKKRKKRRKKWKQAKIWKPHHPLLTLLRSMTKLRKKS
jgi:hypothetical protein